MPKPKRRRKVKQSAAVGPAAAQPQLFDFATQIPFADPSLGRDYAEAKTYWEQFWLIPRYWREYRYRRSFAWRTVRFDSSVTSSLPDQAGVYVFSIRPPVAPPLEGAYVVYVGETTDLRRRFRDYLNEAQSRRARPKIAITLALYRDHLFFSYATLPVSERKKAEDALITALWPPRNDMYPAKIRRVRNAFP